jgi:hypothetical protein
MRKNNATNAPLRVISIGGYGSNWEVKSIKVPKIDPKDEEKRLMVKVVGGYNNKIERIPVPGTAIRRVFLNSKTKSVKAHPLQKRSKT